MMVSYIYGTYRTKPKQRDSQIPMTKLTADLESPTRCQPSIFRRFVHCFLPCAYLLPRLGAYLPLEGDTELHKHHFTKSYLFISTAFLAEKEEPQHSSSRFPRCRRWWWSWKHRGNCGEKGVLVNTGSLVT